MLARVLLSLLMLAVGAGGVWAADEAPKTAVVSVGLTDHKVDENELMQRKAMTKPTQTSGGVAYGWVAHVKKGDHVEVHLMKDGASLMHNLRDVTEDDTDVLLQAGKLGVPAGGWPKGQYTAKVTVTRDEQKIVEQETDPIPFE